MLDHRLDATLAGIGGTELGVVMPGTGVAATERIAPGAGQNVAADIEMGGTEVESVERMVIVVGMGSGPGSVAATSAISVAPNVAAVAAAAVADLAHPAAPFDIVLYPPPLDVSVVAPIASVVRAAPFPNAPFSIAPPPPALDVEILPRSFVFVAAHHAPFVQPFAALYAGFPASADVVVPFDIAQPAAVDGDPVQVPVASSVFAAPSSAAAPFVAVALDGAASAFAVPTFAPGSFAAVETAAAEVGAATVDLPAVAIAAGTGTDSVAVG
jgi:hypothetical protein